MGGLLWRGGFGGVDREIGTVHAAEVTTAALFGRDHMGRMVSLGIKGGGKREDFGGTELHAKAAGFTALNDDGNASFSHRNPHGVMATPELKIELCGGVVPTGCDRGHGWL